MGSQAVRFGFYAEVNRCVGISFDQDEPTRQRFVTDHQMTWPDYFDGKKWGNLPGHQYDYNSVLDLWLVDKRGTLSEMNVRAALEKKVEVLLKEERHDE